MPTITSEHRRLRLILDYNFNNRIMKKIVIAIDGFSSCGKSTMAKSIAKSIGYIYIDSGAMYRAVTLYAMEHGFFGDNGIDKEGLQKDINNIQIRFKLNEQVQQEMGKEKGIVMDGRDIGTTVFPDAELKLFVTASAEVRAQRRYDELKAKGENNSYEEILKNVVERDRIDTTREVSPLKQAEDAIVFDNSNMTIDEQNAYLQEIISKALA